MTDWNGKDRRKSDKLLGLVTVGEAIAIATAMITGIGAFVAVRSDLEGLKQQMSRLDAAKLEARVTGLETFKDAQRFIDDRQDREHIEALREVRDQLRALNARLDRR